MLLKNDIRDFLDSYDGFILDIWGVLHDGVIRYDGVLDAIKEMRRLKKRVVLLSNSPVRASETQERLENFGIERKFYDDLVTSGEATYSYFKENQEFGHTKHGENYYHILGSLEAEGSNLLDGLAYNKLSMEEIHKSDFMVVTWYNNEGLNKDKENYEIEVCAKNNIPLICVNPDKNFITKGGIEYHCAGKIAEKYEELGGKNTVYFGKPYPEVYDVALKKLGINDKSKILAIGDGYHTDIPGANSQGIDSALICGGMLSKRLGVTYGQLPEKIQIEKICKEHNINPSYILSGLQL